MAKPGIGTAPWSKFTPQLTRLAGYLSFFSAYFLFAIRAIASAEGQSQVWLAYSVKHAFAAD